MNYFLNVEKKRTTIQNGKSHRSAQILVVGFQKQRMKTLFLVSLDSCFLVIS